MRNNKLFKLSLKFALFTIVLCSHAVMAKAQVTVPASGDTSGVKDLAAISKALSSDGDVLLESGSTYYTKGNIYVSSNQSITATGATIISKSGSIRNIPKMTNYKAITDFMLDGGVWKNESSTGWEKTMIQFSHGSNITIKNATVYCNYKGHGIELIACKNVMIDNCKLQAIGKCPKNCVEEQLQIDLSTPKTAPTIAKKGAKFAKGQTCQNITVKNCKITGARGVCANFAASEKKYQSKFHKNIILKDNVIVGKSSEAVAMFNVIGATVTNNKITTKSSRINTPYSVGCHFALCGKAPSSIKNAKYIIKNNNIKGGRQGLYFYSHTSSKFGKVTVKGNKCSAKAGKDKAVVLDRRSIGILNYSAEK